MFKGPLRGLNDISYLPKNYPQFSNTLLINFSHELHWFSMEWKKPDALVDIDRSRDRYTDPGKYIDRRERDIDRCREIDI